MSSESYAAILKQYKESKQKKTSNSYGSVDLKKYFSAYLPDGVDEGEKVIRILPGINGKTPFVEQWVHSKKVDDKYEKLICPEKENEGKCPICDAKRLLYERGGEHDIEMAKGHNARKMYVVRVIDRDNEDYGPKWFRFWHTSKGDGVYDKLIDLITEYEIDITDPNEGMDVKLKIKRDSSNKKVCRVVSILPQKQGTKLTEDQEKLEEWVSDTTTWKDGVYGIKSYDYLRIVALDKTPVYSKDAGTYVAKEDQDTKETETLTAKEVLEGKNDNSVNVFNNTTSVLNESTPQEVVNETTVQETVSTQPNVEETVSNESTNTSTLEDDDDDLPF